MWRCRISPQAVNKDHNNTKQRQAATLDEPNMKKRRKQKSREKQKSNQHLEFFACLILCNRLLIFCLRVADGAETHLHCMGRGISGSRRPGRTLFQTDTLRSTKASLFFFFSCPLLYQTFPCVVSDGGNWAPSKLSILFIVRKLFNTCLLLIVSPLFSSHLVVGNEDFSPTLYRVGDLP